MESIKMTNGSLEDQQDDPDSIYNYFKQAIRLRNRYPEIARGIAANVENLSDKNIAAITKTYDGKTTFRRRRYYRWNASDRRRYNYAG